MTAVVRLTSSMLWETERKVLIQGCTCGLTAELLSSVNPSCTNTGQRHIRNMFHLIFHPSLDFLQLSMAVMTVKVRNLSLSRSVAIQVQR